MNDTWKELHRTLLFERQPSCGKDCRVGPHGKVKSAIGGKHCPAVDLYLTGKAGLGLSVAVIACISTIIIPTLAAALGLTA